MLVLISGLLSFAGIYVFGAGFFIKPLPAYCRLGRLLVSCAQVPVQTALYYQESDAVRAALAIGWTALLFSSYWVWRKARSSVPAGETGLRDGNAAAISPIARLEQIRKDKAKLDLEERELEKRPDAHRP